MSNVARGPKAYGALLFGALVVLLVGLRFTHLTGPIDDPHAWRQCDTAYYSLDFYRHGIDLLHPKVCWLGDHGDLILEFPLAEALSALLYRAAGPDPMWDRVVSLVFFLVSAAYLHAIARRVAGTTAARYTTLAYLALPLGQFYSRAAHVDFVATAFAHAWLYHGWRALEERRPLHAGLAAVAGALAALVKAPYLVPVALPLAAAGLAALAASPRTAWMLGGVMAAVPAVAFAVWRRHADAVNGATPDLSFMPTFYKEVNPLWWYLGSWAQRLDPANWMTLARRIGFEIVTPVGACIALFGAMRPVATGLRSDPRRTALLWLAGGALYLLVFFPLNVIHNYYQIPFLAPAALAIGLGADLLHRRVPRIGPLPIGAAIFAAFLAGALVLPGRLGYYSVNWLRVEAGRMVGEIVPADDLVVTTGRHMTHSDPRILFRADRRGWSMAPENVTPDRVDDLERIGARWIAIVDDLGHENEPADPGPLAFLADRLVAQKPVVHDGELLGTLYVYRIGGGTAGGATGAGGAEGGR